VALTKQQRVLVGAAGSVGIVLLALLGWCVARRSKGVPAAAGAAGETIAGALARVLAEAPTWRVPAHCMEADEDAAEAPAQAPIVVGARSYVLDGVNLVGGDATRRRAIIGVAADARGADAATLAGARTAAASFAGAHVDVVVSLGGLGTTRAEIEPVLAALAGGGAWLLVALPGDREAIAAHREAVAALAAKGVKIVDGSALGVLIVDGVALGLVPGAPAGASERAHGLVAGADGCARTRMDLEALSTRLAAAPGPHLVLAHRAPRQRGLAATDLALGGVHVGEVALADLAAHVGTVAFVHADLDETGGRVARLGANGTSIVVSAMMWSDRLSVAVGPLEALPHPAWPGARGDLGASVVEIDHMRARVRAVRATQRNPGTLQ